jgi:excisionase family DNA binding protein
VYPWKRNPTGSFGALRLCHGDEADYAYERRSPLDPAEVGAMNEPSVGKLGSERVRRSERQSLRGGGQIVWPMLMRVVPSNECGPMSDRLATAVAELVAALRDEMASERRPSERAPDRLLSIEQAAQALGIGRTALYSEIGAGRIRSVKVGRRRLVPSSAISEVASGRE